MVKEYAEYALSLAHDNSDNIQMYTRADGTVIKYKKETNDFLIIRRDGELRTLYKPVDGSVYYENDKKNHEEQGY